MNIRKGVAGAALALAAVTPAVTAGEASAAAAWMTAYGSYTAVYDQWHSTVGESSWEDIYVSCQTRGVGGVWGTQIYLWAWVPTATPSGGLWGYVDSRNVNNYNQNGIAGISWCTYDTGGSGEGGGSPWGTDAMAARESGVGGGSPWGTDAVPTRGGGAGGGSPWGTDAMAARESGVGGGSPWGTDAVPTRGGGAGGGSPWGTDAVPTRGGGAGGGSPWGTDVIAAGREDDGGGGEGGGSPW
ncbi:hypothetical protein [Saccharothrix syringae]|uniref:Uncharacterized protein n=1 Tax=Saccharothrix syringae TaxID=103733 RepID=A0A5Q0H233_SACSY|nr:hypothetical protein [Saccharothrix syringae]QFZ20306.1 hypothetical protein EKG83_25380 [Saccharothrix syringae]